MLAHQYKDFVRLANSEASEVEHFDYAYLQPKLDGIRCLTTCWTLQSRRNTPITSCPHIEEFLEHVHNTSEFWHGIKFDGELYIHGADLQTTQSAIARKEYHSSLIRGIKYHIFDVVDVETPFADRATLLTTFEKELNDLWETFEPTKPYWYDGCPIEVVPSYHTPGTDSPDFHNVLQRVHKNFMNSGYEGTIIRNPLAKYQLNYRTYDLLKYKDQLDAEFKVIDVVEGKNSCAIFLCVTATGKKFKVNPAYTVSRKRQVLRYKENYIGKLLTVKYEKLSQEGVPLKPIGHTIREEL
jgi:DNA ligase-1